MDNGYLCYLSIKDNGALDFQLIPYRQGAEKVGIEIFNGDSKEHVLEDIKAISKVIKDDSNLEKKCVEFF